MQGGAHFLAFVRARADGDKRTEMRALDRFLHANQGIAYRLAERFMQGKRGDYEMSESYGAAMRGLYRAACLFDLEQGFTFTTYARSWMLKYLLEYEHELTNHVYRPQRVSMSKASRAIEHHDVTEHVYGDNDIEFLTLRACRHWHLFSVPVGHDLHALPHGEKASGRIDTIGRDELAGEEFDDEICVDGPRVMRYLRDALGESDFALLVALYREGEAEDAFAEKNQIPVLRIRQVREAAFNHARAFIR